VDDNTGLSGADSVIVENVAHGPLSGFSAVYEEDGVHLDWDPSRSSLFRQYEICRNDVESSLGQVIAIISERANPHYVDQHPPLLQSVYYTVVGVNENGYWGSTPTLRVDNRGALLLPDIVYNASVHPTEGWLYARSDARRLWRIDLESMNIVDTRYEDSTAHPPWFEIGDYGHGIELLWPCLDGLHILNAETMRDNAVFEDAPDCLGAVADGSGYYFVAMDRTVPSVRVYRRTTEALVDSGGEMTSGRLLFVPETRRLIEIAEGSTMDLLYYTVDETGHLGPETITSPRTTPLSRLARLSPAHDRFVTSRFGAVYSTSGELDCLGQLSDEERFGSFAFDSTGAQIFAGVSSRRRIEVYDSDSMSLVREYETRGRPSIVMFHGDELVVVSETDAPDGQSQQAVEIVPLD
jgi:hypothetical protein